MSHTRLVGIVSLLAAGVALGAGILVWRAPEPPVPPPATLAFELSIPPPHDILDVTLAQDARVLVYSATADGRVQLFARRLDRFEVMPIPHTGGGIQPFLSPAGDQVAYFANGSLWRTPLKGGEPTEICRVDGLMAGGSWGWDGRLVFAPLGGRGLHVVPVDGGTPTPLTEVDIDAGEVSHGWPRVLPGGRDVLFTIGREGRDPQLAVLSMVSGTYEPLVPVEGGAAAVALGHVVYVRRGEIFVLALSPDTGRPVGGPRAIGRTAASTPAGFDRLGHVMLSASSDGTLVYAPAVNTGDNRLVWVDHRGHAVSVDGETAPHQTPRLSPDGTRIVMAIRSDAFTRDIWLLDVDSRRRRPLTSAAGDNHSPLWSVDGRHVIFASNRDGPQRIYTLEVDSASPPRTLLFGDARTPGAWTPDGRTLFFHEVHEERRRDIRRWDGDESIELIATGANERSPSVSRDGRWLAYVSDAEGGDQVYRRSLSTGVDQRISQFGGTEPVWSPDGTALYFRHGIEMHMLAASSEGQPVSERLFDGVFVRNPGGHLPAYDVAADGRLLMLQPIGRPRALRGLHGFRPDPVVGSAGTFASTVRLTR